MGRLLVILFLSFCSFAIGEEKTENVPGIPVIRYFDWSETDPEKLEELKKQTQNFLFDSPHVKLQTAQDFSSFSQRRHRPVVFPRRTKELPGVFESHERFPHIIERFDEEIQKTEIPSQSYYGIKGLPGLYPNPSSYERQQKGSLPESLSQRVLFLDSESDMQQAFEFATDSLGPNDYVTNVEGLSMLKKTDYYFPRHVIIVADSKGTKDKFEDYFAKAYQKHKEELKKGDVWLTSHEQTEGHFPVSEEVINMSSYVLGDDDIDSYFKSISVHYHQYENEYRKSTQWYRDMQQLTYHEAWGVGPLLYRPESLKNKYTDVSNEAFEKQLKELRAHTQDSIQKFRDTSLADEKKGEEVRKQAGRDYWRLVSLAYDLRPGHSGDARIVGNLKKDLRTNKAYLVQVKAKHNAGFYQNSWDKFVEQYKLLKMSKMTDEQQKSFQVAFDENEKIIGKYADSIPQFEEALASLQDRLNALDASSVRGVKLAAQQAVSEYLKAYRKKFGDQELANLLGHYSGKGGGGVRFDMGTGEVTMTGTWTAGGGAPSQSHTPQGNVKVNNQGIMVEFPGGEGSEGSDMSEFTNKGLIQSIQKNADSSLMLGLMNGLFLTLSKSHDVGSVTFARYKEGFLLMLFGGEEGNEELEKSLHISDEDLLKIVEELKGFKSFQELMPLYSKLNYCWAGNKAKNIALRLGNAYIFLRNSFQEREEDHYGSYGYYDVKKECAQDEKALADELDKTHMTTLKMYPKVFWPAIFKIIMGDDDLAAQKAFEAVDSHQPITATQKLTHTGVAAGEVAAAGVTRRAGRVLVKNSDRFFKKAAGRLLSWMGTPALLYDAGRRTYYVYGVGKNPGYSPVASEISHSETWHKAKELLHRKELPKSNEIREQKAKTLMDRLQVLGD